MSHSSVFQLDAGLYKKVKLLIPGKGKDTGALRMFLGDGYGGSWLRDAQTTLRPAVFLRVWSSGPIWLASLDPYMCLIYLPQRS